MKRRFFLFAAPAIVAAPSLMRISTLVLPPPVLSFSEIVTTTLHMHAGEFAAAVRQTNALAASFYRLTNQGLYPVYVNGVPILPGESKALGFSS